MEKRAEILKNRLSRCVCKTCGSPLSLYQIEATDFEEGRLELYCEQCEKIEFGIEPEIYQTVQYYVEEFQVNFYPDLGETMLTKRMNVARIADILSWGLQTMGYMNSYGFLTEPHFNGKILGECLVLNDQTIEQLEKEFIDDV